MIMKSLFRTILMLALWSQALVVGADEKVVARVDGDPILAAELQRTLGSLAARNGLTLTQLQAHAQFEQLRKRALADLIDRALLYKRARRETEVPDRAVEEAVTRLASQFPDRQTFERQIKAMGYTLEGLRRDMRRELVVQQWLNSGKLGSAEVSEQDLQDYFETNKPLFRSPDLLHLQHILLPAQAAAKVDAIQASLASGENFSTLAQQHSIDHGALPDGDLGFVNPSNLGSRLAAAVVVLQPGAYSTPVTDDDGVHFFRLVEKRPGIAVDLDNVREDIRTHLENQRRSERLQAVLQELQAEADIEILLDLPR